MSIVRAVLGVATYSLSSVIQLLFTLLMLNSTLYLSTAKKIRRYVTDMR